MTAKKTTWILVADGAKARIFESTSLVQPLTLVESLENEEGRLPDRDLVSDRPGQSHNPGGPGKILQKNERRQDHNQLAEAGFATGLCRKLEEAARTKRFDRLVVVAAPTTLGKIRAELGEPARSRLAHEIAKDLTQVNERDLPQHLGDTLRPGVS